MISMPCDDIDADGGLLHESRIEVDEPKEVEEFRHDAMLSKFIMFSSSLLQSSLAELNADNLMQSMISLGLEATQGQKAISVGRDLQWLAKKLAEINGLLSEGNHRLRDAEFRPDFQFIQGTALNLVSDKFKNANWYRLTDIYQGSQISMFGQGVNPNDIEQGELGNCYLLSVVSCLAQYPSRLKRLS